MTTTLPTGKTGTPTAQDLRLFAEGNHRRLWEMLGAQLHVEGATFSVWAPHARAVSVVGDFNDWKGDAHPMTCLGDSGVWHASVAGAAAPQRYKFQIEGADGAVSLRADPLARAAEVPPANASRLVARTSWVWDDTSWMSRPGAAHPSREPMAIYEVHLGSWANDGADGPPRYRDIAPRLAEHARRLGFTHVEFMPVMEHPFGGSWGYQVTGHFAPTSRYGEPDDLRFLVETLHRAGLGVIFDWVPGHFPEDEFALARFDGAPLFEPADQRRARNPKWSTLVFDYGRPEVRNFLIASALYWLREFHVDGLRVDAVSSMLWLDWERKEGDWTPNAQGGRENLDAVRFLRELNTAVREELPGRFTVAEDDSTFPGVTTPIPEGGLGFHFKWNVGWAHDTLKYFGVDPADRGRVHDKLTFPMVYEHDERFIMPLSHDECAPERHSLLEQMWGNERQKLANLRLLLTYMYTRPGKKLLFMGGEMALAETWDHDNSIDWCLVGEPRRAAALRLVQDLGRLYRAHPCLWKGDPDPASFRWMECEDSAHSVAAYVRCWHDDHLVVLLNFAAAAWPEYRVGVPEHGVYVQRLSTNSPRYGGARFRSTRSVATEDFPWQGFEQSIRVVLPPLTAVVFGPRLRGRRRTGASPARRAPGR